MKQSKIKLWTERGYFTKKKILISIVILLLLTSIFSLTACKPDEPPPEYYSGKVTIDSVEDLSVMFGKEYYYPASNDGIENILIENANPWCDDFSEVKYYKNELMDRIEIDLIINDVKTMLSMTRDAFKNTSEETLCELLKKEGIEYFDIEKFKVWDAEIGQCDHNYGYDFVATGVYYKIYSDLNDDVFFTAKEKEIYLTALREYISAFKIYE